jgi:hypothetical protein
MNLSRRSVLGASAAAIVAASLPHRAGASDLPQLNGSAIRSDLDLLRHAYESVHPGLNRYLQPGAFGALIDRAKIWAERDRTQQEIWLMLTRLTAAVRCGHTYPNPNNQTRAIKETLLSRRDRLPITFRWLGARMIVTGGRGGQSPLQPGTEILAVDGMTSRELLAKLMPLARADGSNDSKRLDQLGIRSHGRYLAFDIFRSALMPEASGIVRLRTAPPAGPPRSIELGALTEEELRTARRDGRSDLGWTFEIDHNNLGRLTMPTWVTFNSQWDWQAYLDRIVDRLIDERARGLILDLRGNEGGSDCGWHLLERLVQRDIALPGFERRTRYRRLPDALRQALDTWDDSFRDWGAAASGPDSSGFFRLQREDADVDILRPRGRRFDKPIVVLVDASCSSATFQFANAVRQTGLATLIGETTGGNRRGINGGAFYFLRLPATGFEVDLPIIGFFSAGPQPDRGVEPHEYVATRQEDIAECLDRQMQRAAQRFS